MLKSAKVFSAALLSAFLLNYFISNGSAKMASPPLNIIVASTPVPTSTPLPTVTPYKAYLPFVENSSTPAPIPTRIPQFLVPESSSSLDGVIQDSIYKYECGIKNKFGAHLLISDSSSYEGEIIRQLDKVVELTGKCGWVKGFDPEMDNGSAEKWAFFVAESRKRNLVPVLRLGWGKIPSVSDAGHYGSHVALINQRASFMYNNAKLEAVEVWNEPNLDESWSSPNPVLYANFLHAASREIKSKTSVKVMNGALAFTNGDSKNMATEEFLNLMFSSLPQLVYDIDIWSSHPYPQDFSGCSPWFDGNKPKYCFDAYKVEQLILKKYFLKEIPVFISETSWRSNQDVPGPVIGWWNDNRLHANYTPKEFVDAWKNYWQNDDSVVGITPFQFSSEHERWKLYNFVDPVTMQPNEYFLALQDFRKESGN